MMNNKGTKTLLILNTGLLLQQVGFTFLLLTSGTQYAQYVFMAAALSLAFLYLAIVRQNIKFYEQALFAVITIVTTFGILLLGWNSLNVNYIVMFVLQFFLSYLTKGASEEKAEALSHCMISMTVYGVMFIICNKPYMEPRVNSEYLFGFSIFNNIITIGMIYLLLNYIVKTSIYREKRVLSKAKNDALTNAPNRFALYNYYERVISEETRFTAVAIIDIDYFKQVNDTYGHAIGDKILISVANILKSICENNGYMARWGGEEFVILLKYIQEEEIIRSLFEDLRLQVQEAQFDFDGTQVKVTVTIGVHLISIDEVDDSLETLVEKADQNLYLGKNNGRNQTVFS